LSDGGGGLAAADVDDVDGHNIVMMAKTVLCVTS
jgi:hypothetical protein